MVSTRTRGKKAAAPAVQAVANKPPKKGVKTAPAKKATEAAVKSTVKAPKKPLPVNKKTSKGKDKENHDPQAAEAPQTIDDDDFDLSKRTKSTKRGTARDTKTADIDNSAMDQDIPAPGAGDEDEEDEQVDDEVQEGTAASNVQGDDEPEVEVDEESDEGENADNNRDTESTIDADALAASLAEEQAAKRLPASKNKNPPKATATRETETTTSKQAPKPQKEAEIHEEVSQRDEAKNSGAQRPVHNLPKSGAASRAPSAKPTATATTTTTKPATTAIIRPSKGSEFNGADDFLAQMEASLRADARDKRQRSVSPSLEDELGGVEEVGPWQAADAVVAEPPAKRARHDAGHPDPAALRRHSKKAMQVPMRKHASKGADETLSSSPDRLARDNIKNPRDAIPNHRLGHYEDATQLTLKMAKGYMRIFYATQNAFAKDTQELQFVRMSVAAANSEARKTDGKQLSLQGSDGDGITRLLKDVGPWIRSQMKAKAMEAVFGCYPMLANVKKSAEEKAAELEVLLEPETGYYMYEEVNISDPSIREGPFRHPAILKVIKDQFFHKTGENADGTRHADIFHPIPRALIAFAGAAIKGALDEWVTGTLVAKNFDAKYKEEYDWVVENLDEWNALTADGSQACAHLQEEMAVQARGPLGTAAPRRSAASKRKLFVTADM